MPPDSRSERACGSHSCPYENLCARDLNLGGQMHDKTLWRGWGQRPWSFVRNLAEARGEVGGELAGVNGTRSSPVPRPVVTLGSSSPSPAAPRCGSCLPAALSSVSLRASGGGGGGGGGQRRRQGRARVVGIPSRPPRRGPTGLEEWVWAWFRLPSPLHWPVWRTVLVSDTISSLSPYVT